ncbi:MAG: DUF4251 domain-containing protein [Bacteroidota bacterium]|nr:DUF4251 domain-containing protein [Bacteroidota bacterium]
MKRFNIHNKKGLFLALGFLLIFLNGYSQEKKISEKQLTRQEKKEARKAELQANFAILDSLLKRRTFVLQADYLEDKYGDQVPVPSMINFIMVNENNGVLQTGNNQVLGYNGVGGVTAEGTLSKWEVSKNFKSLSFTIRFDIQTELGMYDVLMTVDADNHARATITGMWPGKLIYNGHINTLNRSGVFKGQKTV